MTVIEHQIEYETSIELERLADAEVINKICRGLHGMAETDYVIRKFEELRRMKYGYGTSA